MVPVSRPDGAHTHGHGGGGLGLVVIVALVLIVAKVGHAIGQAADTAGHVLAVAFEVVMIGLAVLAVAAVAAVLGWVGVRIHRRYANRAAAADRRSLGQPIRVTAEVVRDGPQAIEAPSPQVTGLPAIRERASRDPR